MASVVPFPSVNELNEMHAVYRQGGAEHARALQVVYEDPKCPHPGCKKNLQAIDFRLDAFGGGVHDPIVRSWWNDIGFVGRCPGCGGWIHFTIRGKCAIEESEAKALPRLPDDWANEAVIL